MFKQALVFMALVLLAGCSILEPVVDKGAEEVARLVDQYCTELDEHTRTELRESVNQALDDGNRIVITCSAQ